MKEKFAFLIYALSCTSLGYTAFVHSPFYNVNTLWEGTNTPLFFFPMIIVLMVHMVYTGRMLSLENFSRVYWISGAIIIATIAIMLPRIVAFIYYNF